VPSPPNCPWSSRLKWAGYIYPNAVIRPGFPREFDCCWVHHDFPSQARFAVFADSPEYSPVINGPGQFHLRFTAVAERFEPQSLDLSLTLGTTIDEVRLVPADAARHNREIDNIPLLYPVCTAWERTPWRAAQRAAWEALKRSGEDK